MAGADLKARLTRYVQEQEAALATLEASYLTEKTRLTSQIAAARTAVAAWDQRADALIDLLTAAGIQVEAR